MRTFNSALQTVLANGPPYVKADLWTITLADATVLRWTSGNAELLVGGNTFSLGPPVDRGDVSWKLGLQVDNLKMTITDDGNTTINGVALVTAAWQNLFDEAQIELDRFISDSWSNTAVGATEYFTGIVGEVKVTGKKINLTVESMLAQLKATFPRTYVIPPCANTLYDGVCGLSQAAFTTSGTVAAGATASVFTLTLPGGDKPDDYYAKGKIKFTSGANAGQVRTVKSYVGGVITLSYPLYTVPATGDGVDATAGCDKTRATCNGTFSNIVNFRGFPYVPDPSAQVSGLSGTAGIGAGGSGSFGSSRGQGSLKVK